MKNLITGLAIIITMLGFSQSQSISGVVAKEQPKLEDVSVTVTVDSAAEIESTFQVEDIKEILDATGKNEALTFKIICNGRTMSNGEKSHMSYSVEGNSSKPEEFLKSVEKIRTSAINYYKNKN
ncbi:hypothetical protein [Winogradskyella sp.]|uniref:hypothetical protein n=1 Tax=Winogradskyella sp. TaxID=1883156 RepID=UPI0026117155|nr:hypothetical protein [Winogradskyella sp.]